ncbi:MAG: EamA family transporter [Candidatus Bathyarchaeota archaeon]
MQWLVYAILSAITAALVAIFGKIGLQGVDSITATGIRAGIMFAAIAILMLFTGKIPAITTLDSKSLFYIFLGGLAGAASWIFYFSALQSGKVAQVASIDRLSIVFAVIFAALFLSEKINIPTIIGVSLMATGAIIISLA